MSLIEDNMAIARRWPERKRRRNPLVTDPDIRMGSPGSVLQWVAAVLGHTIRPAPEPTVMRQMPAEMNDEEHNGIGGSLIWLLFYLSA